MFIPLPIGFQVPGRINTEHIERYYREEVHEIQGGRHRIVVAVSSNHLYTAVYESEQERDRVWKQLDRYLTGRDRVAMYDHYEE